MDTFFDNLMNALMPKILLFFKPFIMWFDRVFTVPYSVKKINADHYYLWEPRFKAGTVFITDTYGQGSNLLNPSKGKHGAIYFGTGLKTYIKELIASGGYEANSSFIKFFEENRNNIHDNVEYVIESIGVGVAVTSVIKFMTTKDVLLGFEPKFASESEMVQASRNAVLDLGLPYDYEFNSRDNAKYCFEVLVDAYTKINNKLDFITDGYWGYRVYTASTFKDETMWKRTIDSKAELPYLYKKT